MTNYELPRDIEVYEIGGRTLYVKTGSRNFMISEVDVTPEELVGIANDMAARQAKRPPSHIEQVSACAL
jgi:hypothetical protein